MPQAMLFNGNTIPLTLVVERCEIQIGRWTTPRWQLLGVIAGAHVKPDMPDGIETRDGCTCRIWTDLHISLYKDGAESYWNNLQSDQPRLFVICRPDEFNELQPFVVTADQNEAAAYMEADDTVLSAPIPAEVYQWLEHFVVQYYQPQEPKKSRHGQHRSEEPLHGKV